MIPFARTAWRLLLLACLSTVAHAGFGEGFAAYKNQNYPAALQEFKAVAEHGNAVAMWYIGRMYSKGLGVEKDEKQAFEWFRKGDALGDEWSSIGLANAYGFGQGVAINREKYIETLKRAADRGSVEAKFQLGLAYDPWAGTDNAGDAKLAAKWYAEAARLGHPQAQRSLASCYTFGIGLEKNLAKAFELYRQAAEQGDDAAQHSLASMYERGEGVTQDTAQAVVWYLRAAEQGNKSAQTKLAALYLEGIGLPRSTPRALAWYGVAASRGSAEAQFQFGVLLFEGKYVAKNYTQSERWFRKAQGKPDSVTVSADTKSRLADFRKLADQGEVAAQAILAHMYLQGDGVEKDQTQGFKLAMKAAEQGHYFAQNLVAHAYAHGQGVGRSDEAAVSWYARAAHAKSATAQANLGVIFDKGRGFAQDRLLAFALYSMAIDNYRSRQDGFAREKFKAYANRSCVAQSLTTAELERAQVLAKKLNQPGKFMSELASYLNPSGTTK